MKSLDHPESCEPVRIPNSYKLDRIRPLFAATTKQHELLLSQSSWSAKGAPKEAQRPKADSRLEHDDKVNLPSTHHSRLWYGFGGCRFIVLRLGSTLAC